MKTTVELPEDLVRSAKAEAALRGCNFRDLVEEGLRLVLQTPRHGKHERARPSLEDLMAPARGIVNSGIPDLASNPKHLKDLGLRPRPKR